MIEVRGVAYIKHQNSLECQIVVRYTSSGLYRTFRTFRDRQFTKDELLSFLEEKCEVNKKNITLSKPVQNLF